MTEEKRAYVHSVPLERALLDHSHLVFLEDLKTASAYLLSVNKSLIEALLGLALICFM